MILHPSSSPSSNGFKLVGLVMLFVVSLSAVSEAGMMISPMETDSEIVVVADLLMSADGDDSIRQAVESADQEFGMTVTYSGGNGSTATVAISFLNDRSPQPQLVQWLVFKARGMIPELIPICLLKVPIVVA